MVAGVCRSITAAHRTQDLTSNSQRWSLRMRYTKAGGGGSKASRTPGCSRRCSCPPLPMCSVRASKRFTGRPYSGTSPIGRRLYRSFSSVAPQHPSFSSNKLLEPGCRRSPSIRTHGFPADDVQRVTGRRSPFVGKPGDPFAIVAGTLGRSAMIAGNSRRACRTARTTAMATSARSAVFARRTSCAAPPSSPPCAHSPSGCFRRRRRTCPPAT